MSLWLDQDGLASRNVRDIPAIPQPQTDPVTVDSDSEYVLLGTWTVYGRALTIRVSLDGGALAALKATAANRAEGTHKDMLVDSDFNAGNESRLLLDTSGTNLHQTADGGSFEITLSRRVEWSLWAKKATTDVAVTLDVSA